MATVSLMVVFSASTGLAVLARHAFASIGDRCAYLSASALAPQAPRLASLVCFSGGRHCGLAQCDPVRAEMVGAPWGCTYMCMRHAGPGQAVLPGGRGRGGEKQADDDGRAGGMPGPAGRRGPPPLASPPSGRVAETSGQRLAWRPSVRARSLQLVQGGALLAVQVVHDPAVLLTDVLHQGVNPAVLGVTPVLDLVAPRVLGPG